MNGIIVAAQPEAAEAGAIVLRRGGNAVDAAITAALVQCVVDPQMAGIAGYGSMQTFMPGKGVHEVWEFFARSPLAVTPDMWVDKLRGEARDGFSFTIDGHVNEIGYQAAGTPTSLKGFATVLGRHGTMDLAQALKPAIEYARGGFMIRPYMSYFWNLDDAAQGRVSVRDQLAFSEAGRRLYFHADGQLKRAGERIVNPELATTLERIAKAGPEIFYSGEIAEEIIADFQANGGLLSREDLASVAVGHSDPVWGDYRGLRVASIPPAGGGISLIQALQILDNFDLPAMEHGSAQHLRLLAEVLKRVTTDKDAHIGDPRFTDVPAGWLLSGERATEHADDIRSGRVAHVERLDMGHESKNTTQVCVVDGSGNAVSLTHTLGVPSGAMTASLGIMYNCIMSAFDPRRGRPGSLGPAKCRTSSQTPTIVFDGEAPKIVIGAPGGTAILPALVQGISNVVDFGMTVLEAVAAPRVSVTSDIIDISNRIPRYVQTELEGMGYTITRSSIGYAFAALHALHRDGMGTLSGAADPQRDGMWLRG
ncbi:gamma-glutamyltransferase [Phyllobacterium sp. K27]